MRQFLSILKAVFEYFTTWTCQYKKAFWSFIAIDAPIITIDFSMMITWIWFPEILRATGQVVSIVAGIAGIWLMVVRIRHFNKLIRDGKNPE